MTDTDILAFLKARLDEDERNARAAEIRSHSPWRRDPEPWATAGVVDAGGDAVMVATGDYVAAHIALHDPSRVLREVALKRYLLELHSPYTDGMCSGCTGGPAPFGDVPAPCSHVRAMAAVWSDHPDYNPSWTVE